jgi:hypothetical protein
VAPGVSIYGLWYASNTNYNVAMSGTSMATPLAAGIGSLIHAILPNITVEEMRSLMRSTAEDQVGNPSEDIPGWDPYMGAGRLNAYRALSSICTTKAYFLDSDGDGFGDAQTSQQACISPSGYVENGLDCNDADPSINPDALEVCDEKDNNCNGQIDEGFTKLTYYEDADGDGFGDAAKSIQTCSMPAGYVVNSTDNCPSTANPLQQDLDRDGIGDDCDAVTNVTGAVNAMITDITSMVDEGWRNGLISKLNAAKESCADGNLTAAINQLKAFTNQVDAKRGKGLTNSQANDLITRAHALMEAMRNGTSDCGNTAITSGKSSQKSQMEMETLARRIDLAGYPNPSNSYFTLQVRSKENTAPISFKVVDQLGRIIEVRKNVNANSSLKIGDGYKPGMYFVEILQGNEKANIKLMKASD